MELRGIRFGKVFCASGVAGFFGEGYRFHKIVRPIGMKLDGATFVAKTTTLGANIGNMPLDANYEPVEFIPECVRVSVRDLIEGRALNNVGLSGPGASALFQTGKWQERKTPFFLSFMSVKKSTEERIEEYKGFAELLRFYLPGFAAKIGLQVNFSCPNVGLDPKELIGEVESALDILQGLNVPIMPKFNLLAPPTLVKRLSFHPAFDALCISNTIPFGTLADKIDWEDMYGSKDPADSPLMKRELMSPGPGGLSGRPIFGPLMDWLADLISLRFDKPICAGGGLLSVEDVLELSRLIDMDCDAIAIGSAAILRPWRVEKMIRAANDAK